MMKVRKKLLFATGIICAVAIAAAAFFHTRGVKSEAPGIYQPYADVEAGNDTPTGAVVGLVEALRDWDLGIAAQWMGEMPQTPFTEAYHGVLAPILARIDIEPGAERIDGDTAVVDAAVTAVDIGGALGDLTADAAGYLLTCALERSEPDWTKFLHAYLNRLEPQDMIRVKRSATVYLLRDSGGKWRLDTQNPKNNGFYNAVTGGLIDTLEKLDKIPINVCS